MIDIHGFMALRHIDTVALPTRTIFEEKYAADAGLPAMIQGMSTDWPAVKLWSFPYLESRFGPRICKCVRNTAAGPVYKEFTFSAYLDYMRQHVDEPPFYLTNCQFHLGTDMMEHYTVPEYFRCWYAEVPREHRKYSLSWLYIGGQHTFSSLHLDIWDTSAWNCVVSGKKLWLFFDKSQEPFLYDGEVNPFDPDYDKYPLFRKAVPTVCLQQPGDVVFTPSGWWHAVYNLEDGISITENFMNNTNYKHVLQHFRGRMMPKAFANMKGLAIQHLGAVAEQELYDNYSGI